MDGIAADAELGLPSPDTQPIPAIPVVSRIVKATKTTAGERCGPLAGTLRRALRDARRPSGRPSRAEPSSEFGRRWLSERDGEPNRLRGRRRRRTWPLNGCSPRSRTAAPGWGSCPSTSTQESRPRRSPNSCPRWPVTELRPVRRAGVPGWHICFAAEGCTETGLAVTCASLVDVLGQLTWTPKPIRG